MDRTLAESFVAALGARDWEQLERLLAPDVRLRALVPSALREQQGAADTVGQFRRWFDDATEIELMESSSGEIVDKLHLRWRVHALEEGVRYVVEHQAYATVEDGQITDLALLCSGFQELESQSAR